MPQHGGEAESVDQTERKRQHPAPLRIAAPRQVFDADINNGRGDERLGGSGRQLHEVERSHRQRNRVGERERGDHDQG